MQNKTGLPLMLCGLVLLLCALGLTGYNLWDENRAGDAAEEAVVELQAITPDLSAPEVPENLIPNYVLDPEREMPRSTVSAHTYIGCLSIPSLKLDLPVLDHWSYPNLKVAPCRYAGSAYQNDLVIAAHNYKRHFGGLRNLSVGSAVYFTDVEGNRFSYTVAALEQLEPNQTKDMLSGGWDLTLFTCTLGGQHRVTVRCTQVRDTPVPAVEHTPHQEAEDVPDAAEPAPSEDAVSDAGSGVQQPGDSIAEPDSAPEDPQAGSADAPQT